MGFDFLDIRKRTWHIFLTHQNRTIAIASDFRVDGAKSPEIPQKEGALGSETAARNRKSLATSHRTLKSPMHHCSLLSRKSLRFLGSAMGMAIANRKNRCDFGALRHIFDKMLALAGGVATTPAPKNSCESIVMHMGAHPDTNWCHLRYFQPGSTITVIQEPLHAPFLKKGLFSRGFSKRENGPLRHSGSESGKRPIEEGKRPIKDGKRPINANGQFSGTPPWSKTAPLNRPIKRSMINGFASKNCAISAH